MNQSVFFSSCSRFFAGLNKSRILAAMAEKTCKNINLTLLLTVRYDLHETKYIRTCHLLSLHLNYAEQRRENPIWEGERVFDALFFCLPLSYICHTEDKLSFIKFTYSVSIYSIKMSICMYIGVNELASFASLMERNILRWYLLRWFQNISQENHGISIIGLVMWLQSDFEEFAIGN